MTEVHGVQSPADQARVQAAVAAMSAPTPEQAHTISPAPDSLASPSPAARTQAAKALVAPEAQPQPSPLKDAVAQMRAQREAKQREQEQEAQYITDNRRLQGELDAMRAHPSFEDDPVGYAQARKWSRDQQLMYGKALLYDLAPDKADPDFRIKMFEDRQKREKAREAQDREAQAAARVQEQAHNELRRYTQSMEDAVMTFDAGSYPESEAWYGSDVQGYLRDMLDTAMRLANEAQKAGTVADLRPQAVATKLEADTAARFVARDKRRQPAQPSVQAGQQVQGPTGADAEQSVVDTTSSKNLSGGGAPMPPATTERERIQRAIAAGFRSR